MARNDEAGDNTNDGGDGGTDPEGVHVNDLPEDDDDGNGADTASNRRRRWTIIAIIAMAVLIVAAISVGVAVPLTTRNRDDQSSSSQDSSSTKLVEKTPSPPSSSVPTAVPSETPSVTPTPSPMASPSSTTVPTASTAVEKTPSPPSSSVPTAVPSETPSVTPTPSPMAPPSSTTVPSASTAVPTRFFVDEDPFKGAGIEDATVWRPNRNATGSLQLEVINALNTDWHDIFDAVVDDWGRSSVLTLVTTTVDPDPNCLIIAGKINVCNGNYGDTRWRGISKVLLANGWIYAVTVQLNEFYLEAASDAERRYTLCHNMGHAFGLPHTDEDFFNMDLGNCMDYTNTPEANQRPDNSTFDMLETIYGPVL